MKRLSLFNILALTLILIAIAAILVPPPAQALDNIAVPRSVYDGDSHVAKAIGGLTVTSLTAAAQSQSVTNSQSGVALPALVNLISTGAGTTNGIVLAAPGTGNLYRVVTLMVHPDVTNLLYVADSGTAALSAGFTGGPNDTLMLFGISTGVWAQISTSNN